MEEDWCRFLSVSELLLHMLHCILPSWTSPCNRQVRLKESTTDYWPEFKTILCDLSFSLSHECIFSTRLILISEWKWWISCWVNWSIWHVRGTKKKSETPTEVESMNSPTPGGRSIHWRIFRPPSVSEVMGSIAVGDARFMLINSPFTRLLLYQYTFDIIKRHSRQSPLLHACCCSAGPRFCSIQFGPPPDGGGLVQVLVRVWTPPPHVTLHSPQLDQSV